VTFLLLTNRAALEKLTKEIRTTFQSEDEIDFAGVSALPYLLACLDEALRMYPPVATGLPRVAPAGGAAVCGTYVPEKVRLHRKTAAVGADRYQMIVSIHQWAMYHNASHFKEPFSYHPERWLGDPAFADDNREAFQPFHIGARNCLGRK